MNGYTVMQSNHIKPEVNYREFRIHKLNTPEFSHVRLLLYWPIFGLLFLGFFGAVATATKLLSRLLWTR